MRSYTYCLSDGVVMLLPGNKINGVTFWPVDWDMLGNCIEKSAGALDIGRGADYTTGGTFVDLRFEAFSDG